MKLKYLLFTFFGLLLNNLNAQEKHDAIWVLDRSYLRFDTDTLNIVTRDSGINLSRGSSCLNDEDGALLSYTNGCSLIDQSDQIMKNGDSIILYTVERNCFRGSPFSQCLISLPELTNDTLNFLLYQDLTTELSVDSIFNTVSSGLHYTAIDQNLNSGLGAVTLKDQWIFKDTLSQGYLQACQSANKTAWWIIAPEFHTNCFYILYKTINGFEEIKKQCIGSQWTWDDDFGQAAFSPNGEKFARIHPNNGINIFDFDRCKGILSNTISIDLSGFSFPLAGLVFSPNSRYLYATIWNRVLQFDLEAPDIVASQITVAVYDGISNPQPTQFYLGHTAPDGKIYISPPGQTYNLHVIEEPDSTGVKCNFNQRGIELPANSRGVIPNIPHYRLPLLTDPCEYTPVEITGEVIPPSCLLGQDASIEVRITGAVPPFTYQWSIAGKRAALIDSIGSGFYTVEITDATATTFVKTFLIEDPERLDAGFRIERVSCKGGNDGTFTANPRGGYPPYQFLWSTGDTTQIIDSLSSQIYFVTITDTRGCTYDFSATVTEPINALDNTLEVNPATNSNSNGSVIAMPSGGDPPYTYLWSTDPPQTSQSIVSLDPGTYTVTLSDFNDCQIIDSAVVEQSTSILELIENKAFLVYPNPVVDQLTINRKNKASFQGIITLIDLAGHQVVEQQMTSQATNISIAGLPNGVYYLKIDTDDLIEWHKIIIMK